MSPTLISLDYRVPACATNLDRLPVVIGSCPDAGICLTDHLISPYHCRIEQIDGQLVVTDLKTVHGTAVNYGLVTRAPLMPGDTLCIGSLTFLVSCA